MVEPLRELAARRDMLAELAKAACLLAASGFGTKPAPRPRPRVAAHGQALAFAGCVLGARK